MSSDIDKNKRIQQVHEIDRFIESCENKFSDIFNNFGWSIENLEKDLSNVNVFTESKKKQKLKNKKEEEATSSFDLLAAEEKLKQYEEAIKSHRKQAIGDFQDPVLNLPSTSTNMKQTASVMDMKKLKRDLKRRRIKYRTTKTAPLTFTEELRELINLQMEIMTENKFYK